MRKKGSLIMIICGTVLILSALLLCVYNILEDRKSGQKAQEILTELKSGITVAETPTEKKIDEILQQDIFEEAAPQKTEAPQVQVGENSYIGYITMPALNLELPVMSEWSYSNLQYSPCRYSGTAADNNLVIAAHNYGSHFRNISSLNTGDMIYFTDTDGNVYEYQTSFTEIISGSDGNAMLTDNDNSWDLTLFTCTLDGRNRVTVRAVKTNM